MGSYLLYVPPRPEGPDTIPSLLLELGISDLATDQPPDVTPVTSEGPDGKCGGRVLTWPRPDEVPSALQRSVVKGRQTWQPCKPDPERGLEAGRFWIGTVNGQPVTPGHVQRRQMLKGLDVTLGDGNTWTIPIAAALPKVYGLSDDGKFDARPEPRYRTFCDHAEEVYRRLAGYGLSTEFNTDRLFEFAVEALSLNYRLNVDLVDWLELLTSDCLLWAVGAPVELQPIQEVVESQKKTA